eukprot:6687568-Prymnesium_polylepis.1
MSKGRFLPADWETTLRTTIMGTDEQHGWHALYSTAEHNCSRSSSLRRGATKEPSPSDYVDGRKTLCASATERRADSRIQELSINDATSTVHPRPPLASHPPRPGACRVLSLGSNYDDAFEVEMHASGCNSYTVDPTLPCDVRGASACTRLAPFLRRARDRGDLVNTSMGVGLAGRSLRFEAVSGRASALPLVSLATLLRDAQAGYDFFRAARSSSSRAIAPGNRSEERHAWAGVHIDVLKMDIEGAEFDVLPQVWQLCDERLLSIDQLLVEVHSGGYAATDWQRDHNRSARFAAELHEIFQGAALSCHLMLHHKDLNRLHPTDSEFSWVSLHHARSSMQAARSTGE